MTQIETFRNHLATFSSNPADTTATSEQILNALEETLIEQQDFHRLFDAKLIRIRRQLRLPITQPTSLNNIPAEQESSFREAYIQVAREIGTLFLQQGRLADAWAYFRTIGEPQPIRDALEKIEIPEESTPEFDEVLNLALYEGAHVVLGLRFLLKTHGTCNTITAMGQLMPQMSPEERRGAAAMMVSHLYKDLRYSVHRDTTSREPDLSEQTSIEQLIEGRDWLFADGNYHIDVSHLHATVGFARYLKQGDPELPQAIELCRYGRQLSAALQYPADVPFDDYYPASQHFLSAVAGQHQDAALAYFSERLRNEPDAPDQKLIAFVLVDLAQRIDRVAEVLPVAAEFISRLEDPNGFSFTTACLNSGCSDLLLQVANSNDDVLAMATAMLSDQSRKENV